MADDFAKNLRASAWDSYVSGMLAFTTHPGQTKQDAKPLTLAEIVAKADEVLIERDKRFGGV